MFALAKTYASGTQAYVRPIAKPVAGTVQVAVGGVPLASGAGFSVDHATGSVHLAAAPAAGAEVTAGYEFDVPVRFDSDRINASLAGFAAGRDPLGAGGRGSGLMRAIDPELQARLDGGATHLCRCWLVSRRDGVTLGFTDHDEDVVFDGVVFRASSGMDASALQSATGLSVDNAQAVGALSDAAVSEEDVRAGRFDRAEVRLWLVDWERPELRVLMFRGEFGEIRRLDGAFEVELRGLAEALNAPVGRSVLRTCDRALGRCQVRLRYRAGGVLRGGRGGRGQLGVGPSGDGPRRIRRRLVHAWGADLARRAECRPGRDDQDRPSGGRRRARLTLWQAAGRRPAAGDRFRVVAGCDKRAETCRAKFANFLNFRGFPHIPGDDWVTAYPKEGAIHDGTSLQQP